MPSLFPAPSPELPGDFGSLIVKGHYHASAPIHFALSFLAQKQDTTAMIVTQSRNSLVAALQKYQDDWIKTNHGRGDVSAISSRIKLFYPPSPAHFAYLMMMSAVPDVSTPGTSPWINGKTTFSRAPSLLILHEISSYFLGRVSDREDEQQDATGQTVSSYVSLVAHSLSFLSKARQPPLNEECAFALFDSRIGDLRLPMFKEVDAEPRLEQVSNYVDRYFYWFVEVVEIEGETGQKKMLVYRQGQSSHQAEIWTYRLDVDAEIDGHNCTTHVLWQ